MTKVYGICITSLGRYSYWPRCLLVIVAGGWFVLLFSKLSFARLEVWPEDSFVVRKLSIVDLLLCARIFFGMYWSKFVFVINSQPYST